MDKYVTGTVIRRLRENKKMAQEELADKLHVSSKAVSKWETSQGLPDISLLEPLAKALNISVIELFSGEDVQNKNRASNMLREQFYVCPICRNVIQATGRAVINCCGITLPPLEAETPDTEHFIRIEKVEDEYFVSLDHPMTKTHYISFLVSLSDQGVQLIKLYPEGNAEGRFKINGVKWILAYCNQHGLFRIKV